MNKSKGFTLIEIAIVITIIGILLGAILLRSGSVIGNAKTTDTIALVKDLSAAVNDFKTRYHYLPGDLPLAGNDIPGIGAPCNISPPGTIGDGKIDPDTSPGIGETTCVAEHLVRAGLIKGGTTGIFTRHGAGTPDVLVTARRTTNWMGALPPTFPANVLNEIQLLNQPCETAQGLDSKLDDGIFDKGNIQYPSCTPGSSTDPVPIIDIAL